MGALAWVVVAVMLVAPAEGQAIKLDAGPQLFLDDYLIARSHGVRRVVNSPVRDPAIPNPIITGTQDGCFQPYLTVVRDETSGRFRAWYGARTDQKDSTRSRLAYMESADGVGWRRPHRLLNTPTIQFGASVIDEGPAFADLSRRLKFAWWAPSVEKEAPGGLKLATSPDGFAWTQLTRPGESSDVLVRARVDRRATAGRGRPLPLLRRLRARAQGQPVRRAADRARENEAGPLRGARGGSRRRADRHARRYPG